MPDADYEATTNRELNEAMRYADQFVCPCGNTGCRAIVKTVVTVKHGR
jgi:hypothetical protein